MLKKISRYSGFTLIELLIVMSIIVLLSGLSFSTYQNFQSTIRLNEFINGFEQNIRKVQRDAMLLEKSSNEGWIYGLGIDLRNIEDTVNGTFGVYYPFKWCSGFSEYGDIRTRSAVPNFDPQNDISSYNGNIPVTTVPFNTGSCGSDGVNVLKGYALFGDMGIGTMGAGNQQLSVNILPVFSDSYPDEPNPNARPAFLLFESVTGRALFYDSAGALLNFDYDTHKPLSETLPLEIKISRPGNKGGKTIVISHLSGRIIVKGNEEQN
ncbi:type II secretion system protein [Candidatus Dojkabacteria bacterium]|uniref:Type II secretion system protein n=1 Tax=Candidatus Dojkabacteria bacterium TaxID=2099670 RepID=A0A847D1F1_9BACT|nr:type II secretion system protein [Candidatus Dojkabacteria bacterium]